jgi:hypothetical protein
MNMKRCSYCGAEFSGNETICPTDHQPLIHPSTSAQKAGKPAPEDLRKVHPGAVACIVFGALQFIVPPPPNLPSAEIANALQLKNVGVAVLLIGLGLYLQFRKPQPKR